MFHIYRYVCMYIYVCECVFVCTCVCEREKQTHTSAFMSSSASPELVVKPLKASFPVLLVWPLDLETLFQQPFNLPMTVRSGSFFILFICPSLTSPVSTLALTLLSDFFSSFCIWGAPLLPTPPAALLGLTLWRQVVNQKANFCCHCSHLSNHCCVWGPWHFKPQYWIKHVHPIFSPKNLQSFLFYTAQDQCPISTFCHFTPLIYREILNVTVHLRKSKVKRIIPEAPIGLTMV